MSAPTPVTNSAIVTDSGSTSSPASTEKSPAGTHSNRVTTKRRSAGSRAINATNTATDDTNEPAMAAVASQPARGSPRRRPSTSSTKKPASGKAQMSQAASSISALQQGHVVGGGPVAAGG